MRLTLEGLPTGPGRQRGSHCPGLISPPCARIPIEPPPGCTSGGQYIPRLHRPRLQQELLEAGLIPKRHHRRRGVDPDIIDRVYAPYDNLTIAVSLYPDGHTGKTVVASVARGLRALPGEAGEDDLIRAFEHPALADCKFHHHREGIRAEGDARGTYRRRGRYGGGPRKSPLRHGMAASLMHRRYLAGGHPVALLSLDNCSRNGEKVRDAVLAIAEAWEVRGYVDAGFTKYLQDETKVSYPWSMID